PSGLGSFEDLDRLAGLDLDDRLLPAGLAALDEAAALRLRAHLDHVHALDVDVEQLLDGLPDLRLVRIRVDAERVAVVGLDLLVALLGDHRSEEDFVGMQTHELTLPCTSSSAPSLTRSERAQTSAETSTSDGVTTCTPWRLRNDLAITSSSSATTRTSGRSFPQASRKAAALFVEGSSKLEPSTTAKDPASTCAVSAARSAARVTLRLTLPPKLLRTAKARPPPVQFGARVVPARARPVPFWRQGFERPPATNPRLFADCVPARAAAASARTASWMRCVFTSAAKTFSDSVTSFVFLPDVSSNGAFGAAISASPR